MTKNINGIQQLGVGVVNLQEAWKWYRDYFNMDIKVFEEEGIANLMLPHTEGKPRNRHALLALNMQGGGGFEIWQHLKHKPRMPAFEIQLGDLGITVGKIKTADSIEAHRFFSDQGLNLLSGVRVNPGGQKYFWLKDKFENLWQFVEVDTVFRREKKSVSGGTYGIVVGVNDMDESLKIYRDLLEYDKVMYDTEGIFEDFAGIKGGDMRFRRVLLHHSETRRGAMSPFFGPTEIELVQALDRKAKNIFHCRIWGDPGFIHICFDINGMDALRKEAKDMGYPFTVDSAQHLNTFDMGEAAGSFAYIKAPEGTLIEFVETHKLPLIKALGWYLNFRKRGHRPLPRWILHLFALKRVR